LTLQGLANFHYHGAELMTQNMRETTWKLNGVALMYDESVQVFPVDCVYGIIEVKSAPGRQGVGQARCPLRAS